MPYGVKECKSCGAANGPRAYTCKACGVDFVFKRDIPKEPKIESPPIIPETIKPVARPVRLFDDLDNQRRDNRIATLEDIVRHLAFHVDRIDDVTLNMRTGKKFVRGNTAGTYSSWISNVLGQSPLNPDEVENRDDSLHPEIVGEALSFNDEGRAVMVPILAKNDAYETSQVGIFDDYSGPDNITRSVNESPNPFDYAEADAPWETNN